MPTAQRETQPLSLALARGQRRPVKVGCGEAVRKAGGIGADGTGSQSVGRQPQRFGGRIRTGAVGAVAESHFESSSAFLRGFGLDNRAGSTPEKVAELASTVLCVPVAPAYGNT